MGQIGMALDVLLVVLLAVTLLHAIRLQRAMGQLRLQRGGMEDAVAGFDLGARQAEASLSRLRETAQRLDREIAQAGALRDDLGVLSDRGSEIADRLESLVRSARTLPAAPAAPVTGATVRSQAERDLVVALKAAR